VSQQDGTYRPDLDGLRAVAVVLVIMTHAHIPWANNGGDVGVTAFFVLSGFLITSLLLAERDRSGRVSLPRFYGRRVLRLGPALLLLIFTVTVLSLAVTWPGAWQFGAVSSVFYVSNWAQVAGLNIDPFGHTWSLAIEEQFYLTWPLLIALAGRRAWPIAAVGLVVSTALLVVSTGDTEYFSTLTRGGSLLAGCLLAISGTRAPEWLGAIGLTVLVGLGLANFSHEVTIPLATAATIPVLASSVGGLGRLAPIGRRAYGLYLWNWPLAILLGPIAVPMTFVVAEASYRFLERPVLRLKSRLAAAPVMVITPQPSSLHVGPIPVEAD
jgi:peptidoglycan/LPS O-acetylase OafA/YrhL